MLYMLHIIVKRDDKVDKMIAAYVIQRNGIIPKDTAQIPCMPYLITCSGLSLSVLSHC